MISLLEGLWGVLCVMDDIFVFGQSQEQHDSRLNAVLECLSTAGIIFNRSKCGFSKNQLIFLSHVIDQNNGSPNPSKTAAINPKVSF